MRSRWPIVDKPPASRTSRALLAAAIGLFPATQAQAQLAAAIGFESDYRLRGHSLSAGYPVVTADISYDDRSGLYLGASAIGVVSGERPGFLGAQADIGYAKRLGPDLTIDVGLLRSNYTSRFSGSRAAHYTEAYVGLTRRWLSSRLYVSPDYFGNGVSIVYGEIEAVAEPLPKLQLNAHLGGLTYLSAPPLYGRRGQYDWRLGVSRQSRLIEVHAALSGGGPGRDYYSGTPRSRTAFVVGVSHSF
ncbi:hypothetical protein GCM10009087_39780 [Sphingomonas oligophenolica]|uniref:TorF family putative porin n=1 Tax=Sphingomonas oligophenolica TaxID=301154 RepID=A0ABU9Y2C3_9SPHN